MLERLQEIDTSAIEELARIKRDQEVLEDRLRLMQERKDGVSEVVFERVRNDYRLRLDKLDEQARPLKESARREFAKLQALRSELQQASSEARVAKEEIEFRHALGEFELGDYEGKVATAQEDLDRREVELADVESMAQRFLAAVRSQQELEPGALTAPPTESVTLAAPAGTPAPPLPIAEEVADASSAPPPDPAPIVAEPLGGSLPSPPPAPPSPGGTDAEADFHEAPTGEFAVPPPPTAALIAEPVTTVVDSDEPELSGATRILARPRLVEMDNGTVGREHALALGRTSIGRASDNLIHLLDEAVSRHHAEVVPGPAGYVVRDMGSENGIFVNGDRTAEHVLHEGDVVQIGARTLVYRGA